MGGDSRIIKVGPNKVGLRGLDQAVEEMAADWAARPDEEIGMELARRMQKLNYIPDAALDKYAKALAGHFRRETGSAPSGDGAPDSGVLEIRVLGRGCAQCTRLTQSAMEAVAQLGLAADVEHVTDIKEIASYGVVGSPALLIGKKAVAVGHVPPKERIIKWLEQYTN